MGSEGSRPGQGRVRSSSDTVFKVAFRVFPRYFPPPSLLSVSERSLYLLQQKALLQAREVPGGLLSRYVLRTLATQSLHARGFLSGGGRVHGFYLRGA